MGCVWFRLQRVEVAVAPPCSRLSVGNVDPVLEKENDIEAGDGAQIQVLMKKDMEETDRGLITTLSDEDSLDLLAGDRERNFSIESSTDDPRTRRQSFDNKTVQERGDNADATRLGLGFTCRKGLKPESPNQDSWAVLQAPGHHSIYGVYDGHGQNGHDVSQFVKENLPKLILRDQRFKTAEMNEMMRDVFMKTQRLVSMADRKRILTAQMSGTTATVVVHNHAQNKLTIAHVADSTAVLGSFRDGDMKLEGVALTRDHKPDLEDERARIEKSGGKVVFDGYAYRVYAKNGLYPGLNMSRCIGDLAGHVDSGCTSEPEVSEYQLGPKDHVLLICSDGVWEFVSPQEAVEIVAEFPPEQAMNAADRLAREAWDRWIKEEGGYIVDDITVVLVYLKTASSAADAIQKGGVVNGFGNFGIENLDSVKRDPSSSFVACRRVVHV